jgi:hypothetical protein
MRAAFLRTYPLHSDGGSSWMLCLTRHIAYGHHLSQLDASQIISISTSPVFSTTP